MSKEQEADGENVLEEYEDKWSNPTGSYYYCLVLPNGDVEYHGSKSAIRTRLTDLYAGN
jgi:hypothetical protein